MGRVGSYRGVQPYNSLNMEMIGVGALMEPIPLHSSVFGVERYSGDYQKRNMKEKTSHKSLDLQIVLPARHAK